MKRSKLLFYLLIFMTFTKFSWEDCQLAYYRSTEVSCRSITWTDLKTWSNTERLYIRDSELYHIKSATFRHYNYLNRLYMPSNNITVLEAGSFSGLTKLNYLNLSSNNIKEISKGVFSGMYNLQILDLSNNSIANIENASFTGTDSLRSLYLKHNKLINIPPIGDHCKNLKILDVSNNNIEEWLPLEDCNLQSLNIANNNLSRFIGDKLSSSIIYLNISGNSLDSISGNDFVHLPQLKELSLSHNPLFETNDFPVNLFQNLKDLRMVNLSATAIRKINVGSFSGLQKLEILDISSNDLAFLPNGLFHDLKSLRQLDVSSNHISYFQHDVASLNEINLDKNPWNCDTLADIIKNLNRSKIRRGNSFNTTNLFGIECFDDPIVVNSSNFSELSLEREYLSQIIKTQVDMRNLFVELKKMLILSEAHRINSSDQRTNDHPDSNTMKRLNTTTITLEAYQRLLETKQLNMENSLEKLTNILQLLNNETSTIAMVEKENKSNIKQIVELQHTLVNLVQRNDSNIYWQKLDEVFSDLRRILTEIQNSLTSKVENQKSIALFPPLQPHTLQGYETSSTSGGDTVALYCIFVVLLAILVVVLFILYKRYKHVNHTCDESNPLHSLGV